MRGRRLCEIIHHPKSDLTHNDKSEARNGTKKRAEEKVVPLTHAVAHEWAVVVVPQHTGITISAVGRSWWSDNQAGLTPFVAQPALLRRQHRSRLARRSPWALIPDSGLDIPLYPQHLLHMPSWKDPGVGATGQQQEHQGDGEEQASRSRKKPVDVGSDVSCANHEIENGRDEDTQPGAHVEPDILLRARYAQPPTKKPVPPLQYWPHLKDPLAARQDHFHGSQRSSALFPALLAVVIILC
mmetsp:Transcript_74077/g.197496  ORF Transcript_74077/g.197496 Transcript_74077/m.197496 type:complete len:241 (-) Transcript_74077:24-746(-)